MQVRGIRSTSSLMSKLEEGHAISVQHQEERRMQGEAAIGADTRGYCQLLIAAEIFVVS